MYKSKPGNKHLQKKSSNIVAEHPPVAKLGVSAIFMCIYIYVCVCVIRSILQTLNGIGKIYNNAETREMRGLVS